MSETSCEVQLRLTNQETASVRWDALNEELARSATPWRLVRHYHGQTHFPGWFWSEKIRRRIMYESRLELARLIVAEFDPCLVDVREQVFHLTMNFADGSVIRHIPDFFIFAEGRPPRLVNVKPLGWENDQKLRKTFGALSSLCAQQGLSVAMRKYPLVAN